MNQEYAYGIWIVAALNAGLFLFFLVSFLAPRGKLEWRSLGMVTAFLVALFSEMYGFPLTIYLLSGWLGDAYPVTQPFTHKFGHLWVLVLGGSNWAWGAVMASSLAFLLAGYSLLFKGWRLVHEAQGKLVTSGVYGFARHPQYTGLFLMIVGFLIQWPTLLTAVMAPVLLWAYRRLALTEEQDMRRRFDGEYERYAADMPRFFPPFEQWRDFLTAPETAMAEAMRR